MTTYPILFNQTPESLRRIGARGGRAHARNWRLHQRTASARTNNPTRTTDGDHRPDHRQAGCAVSVAVSRRAAHFPALDRRSRQARTSGHHADLRPRSPDNSRSQRHACES
jgi:hypothetical protein